tara:strand:+ start:1349 stop:1927 length:579 start_codon:yes stop_codon:yes gene_type:complete
MTSIGNLFAHLHPSTKNLGDDILSTVNEFVWCYRKGVESVTLVTRDTDAFRSLVGDSINVTSADRYAVDLGSIGTDKIRIYVDSPVSGEALFGYYFSPSGEMLQRKVYKRKGDKTGVYIDKFNMDGSVIVSNEEEIGSKDDKSFWGGSVELLNNIENILSERTETNIRRVFMKRVSKDQSYIRVWKNGLTET